VKLPSLKVLWLHDNPCATAENYREIVIHHLPNLVKLDNNIITAEEKQDAQKAQFDIQLDGMDSESYAYQEKPAVKVEEKKQRPYSEVPIREMREEKSVLVENNPWRGSNAKDPRTSYESKEGRNGYDSVAYEEGMNRNKNILVAVMSLVKELDLGSLQLVNKEVERLMMGKYK
jgi:cilla- and flagella-associated protein